MLNLFIFGIDGKMGGTTASLTKKYPDINLVGGFCKKESAEMFNDVEKVNEEIDVIIDFSSPSACKDLVQLASKKNSAVVVGTTGQGQDEMDLLKILSKKVPVAICPNLSQGVNYFFEIVKFASNLLFGAEIEVVEYHHSKKADSPSGTAKAIIEKIREAQPNLTALPRTKKREQNEIGVSCVRCGTIVGRHDVIFGLDNETITLSHSAQSREIFSVGAINLARWLKGMPCGLYSMQDFLYKQFNGGFKQEI